MQTAGVACQGTVGADRSMTRHDDRNRIAPVRRAHGPHGGGLAQVASHGAVGGRGAVRNAQQYVPDAALELRPRRFDRQIEFASRPREVLVELEVRPREDRQIRTEFPVRLPLRHVLLVVEMQPREHPTIGLHQQRSDRRLVVGVVDHLVLTRFTGCTRGCAPQLRWALPTRDCRHLTQRTRRTRGCAPQLRWALPTRGCRHLTQRTRRTRGCAPQLRWALPTRGG